MSKSRYLVDEEILDVLLDPEEEIDVKKSLDKGVVIQAKTGRIVPLDGLFVFNDVLTFNFANNFYRSETDKSKEAERFRQHLTKFVQFVDKDFYIRDKDALKKTVDFLEAFDDMLLSDGTRLRYLRKMYANVVSDKIKPIVAAAMAKNFFAETIDVCRFLMTSVKSDVKPASIWIVVWVNYLKYLLREEIAAYMRNPASVDYNELTDTVIATFDTIGRNVPELAVLCKVYVDIIRKEGLSGLGDGEKLSVAERKMVVMPVVDAAKENIANMDKANAAKKRKIAKASATVKVGIGRRIINGVKKISKGNINGK